MIIDSHIMPIGPNDAADLQALYGKAFAPSIHPRAADLLRLGTQPLVGFAMVAKMADGACVGSVQLSPIHLAARGRKTNLNLLGPLMVDPAFRNAGLGRQLMQTVLTRADAAGLGPILLVGDAPYYARFGFSNGQTRAWQMPSLVDQNRVLLRPGPQRTALPKSAQVLAGFAQPGAKQAAA